MRTLDVCAMAFFLAASCASGGSQANFKGGDGLGSDGGVCGEVFYPEILPASQGSGKVLMMMHVNKEGLVQDIAIVNSLNHAVVEEATLTWKKTCKFPADRAAAEAGWQTTDLFWLDDRHMLDERYVSAYLNFKRQAGNGNAGAMFRVAEMTERGQGTGKSWDAEAAKPLYFKAAEAGDARAQAWLGYQYMFGITLPLDQAEGLRWLRLAADKGNPGARHQLARWYERSDNAERDVAQARSLYRMAYEGKDAGARLALARMLLGLPKAQRDPVQAAALYTAAAKDGDPRGMSGLSALYASGVGVAANLELSEKWLEEAFKARDPRAAMMRGDQRMSSASADTERGDACGLYRQAAERGYAPAQARLAQCFVMGKGWVQDIQRARLWYELAAAENDATAMAALAGMAEHGVGQSVDAGAALHWYRLAAQQDEVSALERLCKIYSDGGLGQAPDAQQAALWLARLQEARSVQ